jgi:hypothetical protein
MRGDLGQGGFELCFRRLSVVRERARAGARTRSPKARYVALRRPALVHASCTEAAREDLESGHGHVRTKTKAKTPWEAAHGVSGIFETEAK